MGLQSNAFAIMQQNKQKQNTVWHDDFFATFNNKVWDEPSLFWEPGMDLLDYKGLEAGNPTESWSTYANAAKSRGMNPDYKRFMETFKSIKGTRGTKILDKFQQLQSMYGSNRDFTKALKKTFRDNPKLRKDLSEGIRLNPEHPGAAGINLSFQDYGQDAWEGAKGDIVEAVVGEKINPMALGAQSGRTVAKLGAAAVPWMGGGYSFKQAAGRALIPGAGFFQAKDAIKGFAGKGPLASSAKFGPERLEGWRKEALKQKSGKNWFGNQRGRLGGLNKRALALEALGQPKDLTGNWKTKANQTKIRGWKKTLGSNLRGGLTDLKKIRGSLSSVDKIALDKKIKHLKTVQKSIDGLGKSGKRITKKAFEKVAQKGLGKSTGKTLAWAVEKVGWKGILKRAGWKLGAKIVASGVMKAATPVTYGLSGLLSAGMDAWMAYDIIQLVNEISKEYGEQKDLNKSGSSLRAKEHLNATTGGPRTPKYARTQ